MKTSDGVHASSHTTRVGFSGALPVRFDGKQMFVLGCIIMITWEAVIYVSPSGLLNGGSAGLVFSFLFVWSGMTSIALSLSELTSMLPSAAGQYAWVAYLSSLKHRRFWSFIAGWQLTLAWQADYASVIYLGEAVLQSLIQARQPDFVFTPWQGTLVLFLLNFMAVLISFRPQRLSKYIDLMSLVVHLVGFVIVIATLVVTAVRSDRSASAREVFTSYRQGGGYNPGLTFLVGVVASVYPFIGADGIIHMSEEATNPRRSVPISLTYSVLANGLGGFCVLLAVLFNITDDNSAAYSSANGLSFLQLLAQTQSGALAEALGAMIFILVIFCSAAVFVATTRITWAFARDGGLPFSGPLARINPTHHIPVTAYILTILLTLLLSLINLGSLVAFNAVISLVIASFFGTYALPIYLIARQRWRDPSWIQSNIPKWNLGRFGLAVNVYALIFITFIFFFCFWPVVTPVTAPTMNWAILMWGASMLFGVVFYHLRKHGFSAFENAKAIAELSST
ncbi:Amino acid permease-like protein 19 [Elsinoe fawcettii]|nr:Amino acid permease-like protein 19 [Elsinoe fawcettii]